MILTCNACNKKFVVPDSAIIATGRMVQCGSCGNKWRQFPENKVKKTFVSPKPKAFKQKIEKPKKAKKPSIKKPREISLYSPEYLAKKHGIKINELKPQKTVKQIKKTNISFGFFNTLILFTILFISISRILYFSQSFIVNIFPLTEFYLDYFFESVRNIFEVWKNLITY